MWVAGASRACAHNRKTNAHAGRRSAHVELPLRLADTRERWPLFP
jgi:hypothetical protein